MLDLTVWLLCGILNFLLAEKFKRNTGMWVALGICFSIFSVLVLLVIGEKKEGKRW